MRANYRNPTDIFDICDLASKDPIKQFDEWFQTAKKDPAVKEPNAMCISTSTP
jgi:pyridoxine/pyridoxamine 5'-phosphate oxidase